MTGMSTMATINDAPTRKLAAMAAENRRSPKGPPAGEAIRRDVAAAQGASRARLRPPAAEARRRQRDCASRRTRALRRASSQLAPATDRG